MKSVYTIEGDDPIIFPTCIAKCFMYDTDLVGIISSILSVILGRLSSSIVGEAVAVRAIIRVEGKPDFNCLRSLKAPLECLLSMEQLLPCPS